jgi:hypothetical protein
MPSVSPDIVAGELNIFIFIDRSLAVTKTESLNMLFRVGFISTAPLFLQISQHDEIQTNCSLRTASRREINAN